MNEIQEALLEMMVDIDAVMRKHDVDYFMSDGTVLGAVRHKGFIPWDDDADLIIKRKDVKGFLGAMEELEASGKYYLQRPLSTDWPYLFYKVRLNGSTAIEDKFVNTRVHQGLFIDVFVLEAYPNSGFRRKLYEGMMLGVRGFQGLCDGRMGKRWFNPILWMMKRFVSLMNRMMDMVCEKDNRWCCVRISNSYGFFNIEDFEETVDMEYEGHMFKAMNGYDGYLKVCYGDYMTPPPEDKRVGEHLTFFDRNLDYREWLKDRKD